MNTEIYLRRRNKIVLPTAQHAEELPDAYLVTLQKNLEVLGYELSQEALRAIRMLNEQELTIFYSELIDALGQLVGAHVKYQPMYPNFPQQVADANAVDLYINAQLHYFGDWLGTRILPHYDKMPREVLPDKVKLKVIDLGSSQDFESIFINLMRSQTSLNETDRQDIEWFIKTNSSRVAQLLPTEIPNKENVATMTRYLLAYSNVAPNRIQTFFKTATDVLRLFCALSDGDVSLAAPTKFISPSRAQRRMLLGLLENCGSITEDMLRYKEQWKRAGERLHPSEYTNTFPKTAEAFQVLRDDVAYETFNSTLEKHLLQHDIPLALAQLKTRPGELARRLDVLLRMSNEHEKILDTFRDVSSEVSSTVLLQLSAHFKERNHQKAIRVFFPKGNVGKAQAIANTLPKLNEESRQKVMVICSDALKAKYGKLAPLGKVYIDRELKKYTVPLGLRSASRALRTIGRGSRLTMPAGNTVRFFIWWKDGMERTDIDLSALALDENSQFKMQITYYNLKEYGGYHSGDITSAPNGASEFIDLDIDKLQEAGVRYVVMSVNSYTQQPFYELPECFAGFMVRQAPQSGEIYEPKTVSNKIDLTANTSACLPLIIDIQKRTVIWTDLAVSHNPSHSNNVINNMSSLTIMNEAMVSLVKPSLYDLFTLHAEARGEIVKSAAEADIIFSLNQGVTPFDTDKIVGEFL